MAQRKFITNISSLARVSSFKLTFFSDFCGTIKSLILHMSSLIFSIKFFSYFFLLFGPVGAAMLLKFGILSKNRNIGKLSSQNATELYFVSKDL